MSILKFLKPKQVLPNESSYIAEILGPVALEEANENVRKVVESSIDVGGSSPTSTPGSVKRGTYTTFSPKDRADIGKYCSENGPAATLKKFKMTFPNLSESTARGMRKKYLDSVSSRKRKLDFDEVSEIPAKKRGRPLLIGTDLDNKLKAYVKVLRENGAVINTQIVIAAATGIILATDKSLLSENGGSIVLSKNWAKSFLNRMNFVKRRGSTACKADKVENFEQIKKEFLERIEKTVVENDIPSDLIINWDHAGLNIIPVSNWTMEVEGSKRVEISGLGDKRQITAVFAGTLSGDFLPPQLIYGGKTDKCHPVYKFPANWHVTHSENHWANSETQLDYIKHVILPYIKQTKRKNGLPNEQKALCIFDVFKAQMSEEFRNYLQENNVKIVYVPACCTDRLQPLDVSVQKAVKNHLRESFQHWYSDQIMLQLKDSDMNDSDMYSVTPVDLSLTKLKPLTAKWLVKMHQHIKNNPDIVKSGFRESGISLILDDHLRDELPLSKRFT